MLITHLCYCKWPECNETRTVYVKSNLKHVSFITFLNFAASYRMQQTVMGLSVTSSHSASNLRYCTAQTFGLVQKY